MKDEELIVLVEPLPVHLSRRDRSLPDSFLELLVAAASVCRYSVRLVDFSRYLLNHCKVTDQP